MMNGANSLNLTLSEPIKKEVSSNSYCQNLRLHGKPLIIRTPEFERNNGLKFIVNGSMKSVLVPLDDTLRGTLSEIETFVTANVASPTYKPLWLKDYMYIPISKWCNYEQVHFDGSRTKLTPEADFGKGRYSLDVQVANVYVGPHRGGATYSLNLFVRQIIYKTVENDDIMDIVEVFNEHFKNTIPQAIAESPNLSKPQLKAQKRSRANHRDNDERKKQCGSDTNNSSDLTVHRK